MESARELGRAGRVGEALRLFRYRPTDLCPGSRIDDAVQEAAVYLSFPSIAGRLHMILATAEELNRPPRRRERIKATRRKAASSAPAAAAAASALAATAREREIEQKLAQPCR